MPTGAEGDPTPLFRLKSYISLRVYGPSKSRFPRSRVRARITISVFLKGMKYDHEQTALVPTALRGPLAGLDAPLLCTAQPPATCTSSRKGAAPRAWVHATASLSWCHVAALLTRTWAAVRPESAAGSIRGDTSQCGRCERAKVKTPSHNRDHPAATERTRRGR